MDRIHRSKKEMPLKPTQLVPKGKDLSPKLHPAAQEPMMNFSEGDDEFNSDESFDEDFNMMEQIKRQRQEIERKKLEEIEARGDEQGRKPLKPASPYSTPTVIPEKDRQKLKDAEERKKAKHPVQDHSLWDTIEEERELRERQQKKRTDEPSDAKDPKTNKNLDDILKEDGTLYD